MCRHCAIKSDVLPRYEIPKFSEGDVSQHTLPNRVSPKFITNNTQMNPIYPHPWPAPGDGIWGGLLKA